MPTLHSSFNLVKKFNDLNTINAVKNCERPVKNCQKLRNIGPKSDERRVLFVTKTHLEMLTFQR